MRWMASDFLGLLLLPLLPFLPAVSGGAACAGVSHDGHGGGEKQGDNEGPQEDGRQGGGEDGEGGGHAGRNPPSLVQALQHP